MDLKRNNMTLSRLTKVTDRAGPADMPCLCLRCSIGDRAELTTSSRKLRVAALSVLLRPQYWLYYQGQSGNHED